MNIKRKLTVVLAGIVFSSQLPALAASPSVWNSDGSGNWADPSRWVDGNVPQSGYQVRLTGNTYATDADKDILEKVAQIVLPGSASVFTIHNDVALSPIASITGEGKVVKTGTGDMSYTWTSTAKISTTGGFAVSGGRLLVSSELETVTFGGLLSIAEGCTASFSGALKQLETYGLEGAGTLANEQEKTTVKYWDYGGSRTAPYSFGGRFDGSFQFYGDNCGQLLVGEAANILTNTFYQYTGLLGSTLLPTTMLVFRNNGVFEYLGLGDEESAAVNVNFNNNAKVVEFDAGPHGGATFNYRYCNPGDKYTMNELILSGSNAATAVFNGSFSMGKTQDKSQNLACYLKKTGTGTWRMTAVNRDNRGTVAVEQGTLEYASIAEKGTSCSLGNASVLQSEYTGTYDASKNVDYACLIGNGTNVVDESLATLAYVGEAAATVTTRPVAVKGAARFASETAALNWTGFSAETDDSQLVLGGAAANCVARGISKSDKTLMVSKDGTGDWTLDGALDADALYAREGELKVKATEGYTWYKINFTKNRGASLLTLVQIAFWNETGLLSENLVFCKEKTSKTPALNAGEVTFEFLPDNSSSVNNTIGEWFKSDATSASATAWKKVGEVDSSRVVLILRLPAGKANATHYDFRLVGDNAGIKLRDPTSWTISASRDGVSWTDVGSVADLEYERDVALKGAWCSSQSFTGLWTAESHPTGFPLETYDTSDVFSQGAPLVGAAEGGTLSANVSTPASGIFYDAALGGGTIDGFDFSSADTLKIANLPAGTSTLLPLTFQNCTGLDNIGNWTVVVDGKRRNKSATLTPEGILVSGAGMLILFK